MLNAWYNNRFKNIPLFIINSCRKIKTKRDKNRDLFTTQLNINAMPKTLSLPKLLPEPLEYCVLNNNRTMSILSNP